MCDLGLPVKTVIMWFHFSLLLTGILTVKGFLLPNVEEANNEGWQYVKVDVISTGKHNLADDPFPSQLKIRLQWEENIEIINVFKNSKVTVNTPVYVSKDQTVSRQQLPDNIYGCLYENKLYGASFLLNFRQLETGLMYTVFGKFLWRRDEELLVEPAGTYSEGRTVEHYISENIMSNINIGEYTTVEDLIPIVKRKAVSSEPIEGENYVIELLFVVDFSVYSQWYENSRARTRAEKDIYVKQSLRQYYGLVFSEIDMRLENMDAIGFSLEAVLVGLYIADSEKASPWTNSDNLYPTLLPAQRDAEDTLDKLRRWVALGKTLPAHDHVIGFTALDLMNTLHSPPIITAGMSSLASICTVYSQSILSDSFTLGVARVALHQIAHSFGADHDGLSERCKQQTGLAMDPDMKMNSWSFSKCSLKSFILQMYLLNNNGYNCLAELGTSFYPSDNSWLTEVQSTSLFINQTYDDDYWHVRNPRNAIGIDGVKTVCTTATGDQASELCRGFYPSHQYFKLCLVLMCLIPSADHGLYGEKEMKCKPAMSSGHIICGKNKWCDNRKCVTSPTDVGESDDCPLGDQPGTVFKTYDNSGTFRTVTCVELVQFKPFLCYYPFIEQRCCSSCATIGHKERLNCEYGDIGHCTAEMCSLTHPNGQSWRCCDTCFSYTMTTPEGYATTEPECKGDLNGKVFGYEEKDLKWPCAEGIKYVQTLCYDKANYEACCASCNAFAETVKYQTQDIVDCKFRDRDELCWRDYCDQYTDRRRRFDCCFACSDLQNFHEKYTNVDKDCTGDTAGNIADLSGNTCSWITDDRSSYCYIENVTRLCCATCRNYFRNNPGCEYGDRYPKCSPDYCYEDTLNEREMCCDTCHDYVLPQAIATKTRARTTPFWPHSTILIMMNSAQGFYVKCLEGILITVLSAISISLAAVYSLK